jgi:SAM-dependent methyltransferase
MSRIIPSDYSFTRYLAAKKSVDDRALNEQVWQALEEALPKTVLQVLEIGAGIGTMVERIVERQLFAGNVTTYTAIDAAASNIKEARRRQHTLPESFTLQLETVDLFDFAAREQGKRVWDLLIAHAFLDLVDLAQTLPILFSMLKPGSLFYFTLNFDGGTIFQPVIDPDVDPEIITLYHRTMDERFIHGISSGDSRTGRHMFNRVQAAGGELLAAGSSDWVVFAGKDGYPADEAYFLHFIIHTVHQALQGHPDLDGSLFEAWIAQRHAQIEAGSLVYIAHQLDFLGRRPI